MSFQYSVDWNRRTIKLSDWWGKEIFAKDKKSLVSLKYYLLFNIYFRFSYSQWNTFIFHMVFKFYISFWELKIGKKKKCNRTFIILVVKVKHMIIFWYFDVHDSQNKKPEIDHNAYLR